MKHNLEVTNCFPFPRSQEEETDESRAQGAFTTDGAKRGHAMMCLHAFGFVSPGIDL